MKLSNEQMEARAIIIDRYENPINKVENPANLQDYKKFNNKSDSCIDNLTVYLKFDKNKIIDAKFDGIGCAISVSSTDLFCDLILNKNIQDVEKILLNYFLMISLQEFDKDILLDLNIFSNIGKQINRVKCSLVGHGAIKKILEEM